jgi:signal transduction histidine kinase
MRRVAVHLAQMATLAGLSAYVLFWLDDGAPALNRHVGMAILAAYMTIWLALLANAVRPAATPELARRRWRLCNRFVAWAGTIVIVAAFWIGAAYAEPSLLLVVVVYQVGVVTFVVMGSIRRPPARPGLGLQILIIPASIGLWYALHWQPHSPAMILFALAYGYVVLSLRGVLQRAVTRETEARQAAEAALGRVAAEQAARSRFLASASHDLGQPLQAARLFFEQAMRSPDPAQRERAQRNAAWAFDSSEQLLEQMLDHLRLEAGAVKAHPVEAPVGSLIARVAELHEAAARLAGTELVAMPTDLAAIADPALAERALGNLVANSLRHAKATRVLIGARRRAGRVRLWVIDDGVGVCEADAPRLFEDYVQGSDRPDEIRGGFGLGLGSARRIAELMGGAVGLDRKWTHGAAFWLDLPTAPTKPA